MRGKKAVLNFAAGIIELIFTTVASFIVPHFIIRAYGSSVNGLLTSITQFLSYIALIESGIGAIGRSSLYKPLAENDSQKLSENVKAIENFYRKISYIFIAYTVFLAAVFPVIVKLEHDFLYVSSLVIILAINTLIQYYFGITYQTVIQADQRKYIPSVLQTLTLIVNTIITMVLINCGMSIHLVKMWSLVAFAIRPFILYFYVRSHYSINGNVEPNNEILKQRWDGLAQHIAFFIHKNTDVVVLTILANVKEVSVYSVYMLAVSGCSKLVNIFSSSLEPAFGNMIAKGESETLKKRVRLCSTLTIQVAIILFSTAAIAVSPFIKLYTRGVTDVDYLRPAFGIVMLIAEGFYCVRLPYQSVVYAAGHFKQTRNGAIMEAVLNLSISVVLVFKHGLIGVAIGTLISMLFRTLQYIYYYWTNLIGEKDGLKKEAFRIVISTIEIGGIILFASFIPEVSSLSYMRWILSSCLVGIGCSVIVGFVSLIFYRTECQELLLFVKRLISRSS